MGELKVYDTLYVWNDTSVKFYATAVVPMTPQQLRAALVRIQVTLPAQVKFHFLNEMPTEDVKPLQMQQRLDSFIEFLSAKSQLYRQRNASANSD